MALYTISDLHLSVAAGKPMDVFGAQWHDHAALLAENWKRVVRPDDTVVLAGDHSWGLKEAEYVPDLEFINALPGRKILTKGNHDLWWATASKLRKLTEKYGLDTLSFMQGNAVFLNRGTDPASENLNMGTDPAPPGAGNARVTAIMPLLLTARSTGARPCASLPPSKPRRGCGARPAAKMLRSWYFCTSRPSARACVRLNLLKF